MPIDTPHLKFPFHLQADGTSAMYTEQDSDDDIMDCVEILLRTERGSRIEVPDYGIPDQVFREAGADYEVIEEAISEWEPRADAKVRQSTQLVDLTEQIRVEVVGTGA